MAESIAVSEYEMQEPIRGRVFFPPRQVLCVLLVCAGYYAGALIGKSLKFPDSHLALIWPPTAIVLAALLLAPPRKWWVYLLAVSPVHILVQMHDNVPGWGIVSQLVGNFGQAFLAATAVRYIQPGVVRFDTFRGTLVFSLCAAFFAPVFVSTIASYLYVLSGWEQDYWYVWRARVLSNVLSTLTIVPPLLVGASEIAQTRKLNPRRFIEAGLIAIGLVLTGVIASRPNTEVAILLYAPLPLLLWAAVRFGVGGLCLSILATAYMVFLDASGGQGPFTTKSPADNVLSLQLFLITISLPLMFLAALTEERRDKEKALSESEARYRALVMASADTVWLANERGEGFLATQGWQSLTGQNEKEMRDFGWLDAVHPDDRERSRRLWEQAIDEKRAYENELRVRTRAGSYRFLYVHAVPIVTNDGRVHEWVGANTDITERKQAEEALKQSENQVRLFVEHTPASIAMFDREMRYMLTSCRWLKDYNLGEQSIIGRSHYEVFPEIPERWKEIHRRCLAGAVETCEQDPFPRLNGTVDWVRWEVRPWYVASGEIGGIIMFTEVVTDRKRAESELQLQREELAHITRISTMGELAASLAHELNQPLTAILSNAQAAQRFLAANPADLEEVREILKDIVQDNNRAGEVIRRMRALVRKEELEFEPLDLASVIGDVVTLVHSDAVLRNIRVLLEFSLGLPMVRGDRIQLQQVALNLLLNAFEATEDYLANDREVVLRGDLDDARAVRVAVRDRGIGLSSDKLDKIFEPFYTTKRDGLGMGLSISRSIIEAHGGRLWAENNPDRGATFYFTVPVEKRDEGRVSKEER